MTTADGKDIGDLLRQTVERENEERGWVQLPDEEHRFTLEEAKELAARWEAARDPSVRDVLARLDQIEAKLDALHARMDADEVARG